MNVPLLNRIAFLGLGTAVLLLANIDVAAADDYPVIFTSYDALRKVGISLQAPHFNNKCYYYGDGGYTVSLSDEFLGRFLKKGFSLQSACLGLVSTTHYDPETGRRLATYMLIDRKNVAKRVFDDGSTTEELPFELPPCFKNGTPYTDCTFRYGRLTGKTLSGEQTDAYKRLGAAIDTVMAKAIENVADTEKIFGSDPDEELIKGFRGPNGDGLPTPVDASLDKYSSFMFWARSSKFPHGYGYALDADGAAGPSLSDAAMNLAIKGLNKPQTPADAIKHALDSQSQ